MQFTLIDIFLSILFTAGIVVMFWALNQERIEKAPFYVYLVSISTALTIAATFIAALVHR